MIQLLAEAKDITSLGKVIDIIIFAYVAGITPLLIYYASKMNKKPLEEKKQRGAKPEVKPEVKPAVTETEQ